MISDRFPIASWFLLVSGSFFLIVFALPLFLAPLKWARVFRWRLPEDTDLTVYFGRCLGGVALSIVAMCFFAAGEPEKHVLLFHLITLVGVLMTIVHVWGAIERTQPWTETAEIALYFAVAVLAYWIGGTLR